MFLAPFMHLLKIQGFPGGAVVENLPANAGDTGSSPGPGRSHMPRSNWARERQLLSLRVWSLCSATREAARVRGPRTAMKSGPRWPQLEEALAQKRRPNTAKNKLIKFKKIQLIELSFTLYLFLCLQLSVKTSSTLVHPHVGNYAARTSIHFQYPWLLCTNSFHVHPWALACLSPLSICLDSNVPACGWLDPWHGIESPNNARGLHGQTAFHSQRHLFWWWGSSL